MKIGWLAVLCAFFLAPAVADHGVILLYHHVDEETPASTSVTPAQFSAHLDYIENNGFVVVPLDELLDGVFGSGDVPDNAVAITFDDAYESVYSTAFPELAARGMPFAVFVATDAVDQGYAATLSRAQLRELHDSGLASIGAHSRTHEHLLRGSEQGSDEAWNDRVSAEIDDSVAYLTQALSTEVLSVFAYPYGEYSPALEALLAARELFGLAQFSGAVGAETPRTAIPRFSLSRSQGSLERLALALDARPLPVTEIDPGDTLIRGSEQAPGVLGFSLPADERYQRERLACFSASGGALALVREADRVTVSLPPLQAGRNKVNCTVPSTERRGEFFWFAQQWVLADPQGRWLTQ
tara:strand:+ start:942 stop:2003 length:1062 start_codon:yes stop_codon:yes gene_type:complete